MKFNRDFKKMRDLAILVNGVSTLQAKETNATALGSKCARPFRGTAWRLLGDSREREQRVVGVEVREVVGPGNAVLCGLHSEQERNQYRLCRVPIFSMVLPTLGIT